MRLRRVRADDRERVQQFVRGLSARSRRERFLAPVVELSSCQLERITSSPGLSLAALDEQERIIALAEYAPVDGCGAELAVVVADEWQGHGVGARLMAALIEHAGRCGIARLQGVTRTGNEAMGRLARKLGFAVRPDDDPGLLRLERALTA